MIFSGGWCVAALLGIVLVAGFNGWMWWRERGQKWIAALPLTAAARQLLEASTVEATPVGLAVLCPAGTTFDAAEALRLELVAKVPTGVTVDVQIAPSLPGELSAEDEAGERLHVAERAARLAPVRLEVDEEPFPWDE